MLHLLSLTVWFPHVDQGDVLVMQEDNQQKLSNELVTCHSLRIHVNSTRLGNTPGQLLWDDKTRPWSRWIGKGYAFTFNGHRDKKSGCIELTVNLIINSKIMLHVKLNNKNVFMNFNTRHEQQSPGSPLTVWQDHWSPTSSLCGLCLCGPNPLLPLLL